MCKGSKVTEGALWGASVRFGVGGGWGSRGTPNSLFPSLSSLTSCHPADDRIPPGLLGSKWDVTDVLDSVKDWWDAEPKEWRFCLTSPQGGRASDTRKCPSRGPPVGSFTSRIIITCPLVGGGPSTRVSYAPRISGVGVAE